VVDIQEIGIIISLVTGLGAPLALFMLARHTRSLDTASDKADKALTKEDWKEQKGHIYNKIDSLFEAVSTIHAKLEEIAATVKWHEKRLSKLNGFDR